MRRVRLLALLSFLIPSVAAAQECIEEISPPKPFEVVIANEGGRKNEDTLFKRLDTCFIHEPGVVQERPITTGGARMFRYRISVRTRGRECPDGTLFFLEPLEYEAFLKQWVKEE